LEERKICMSSAGCNNCAAGIAASVEDVNAVWTAGLVCWACVLAQNTQDRASRHAIKLYRRE